MYETLLIPTDGSNEASKGAEHGLDLAASLGATVHALYVIDLPGAPRTVYVREDEEQMREDYREYGEGVTADLCAVAAEKGVECVTATTIGSPPEEIVAYADEEGMDAIVMGSAYRGKVGAILGSTTERVVRSATVPVITNRMQMEDRESR